MKYIIITSFLLLGCQENSLAPGVAPQDTVQTAIGDAYYESFDLTIDMNAEEDQEVQEETEREIKETHDIIIMQPENYPSGPYAIDKFSILPDMTFYDPWTKEWFNISELYKHDKHKAFILVSSAGWCGPCIMEAAALISIYSEYSADGLEIIYTLGNTNLPGDVPFDNNIDETNSASFHKDLEFMENYQFMVQDAADKKLNYKMLADPNREILKYVPGHAWPLSILVTTKDMGVRLVEEGYWGVLMENKIMLVLYNDVPTLPFE